MSFNGLLLVSVFLESPYNGDVLFIAFQSKFFTYSVLGWPSVEFALSNRKKLIIVEFSSMSRLSPSLFSNGWFLISPFLLILKFWREFLPPVFVNAFPWTVFERFLWCVRSVDFIGSMEFCDFSEFIVLLLIGWKFKYSVDDSTLVCKYNLWKKNNFIANLRDDESF